jgi:hypothetical protein
VIPMVKIEIHLDDIDAENIIRGNEIRLEARGSVHKDGTLIGKEKIETQIIIKGDGVKDILAHLPGKSHMFLPTKTHFMGRKIEIIVHD